MTLHLAPRTIIVLLCGVVGVAAHDFGSTPITWNREISRIVYARCASCHRPAGTAFSLMTYADAQPKAIEIKEAVLSRRMPPWGAVKGFGSFRNDRGLTQQQIELFTDWVEGGTPRGNNRRALPEEPRFAAPEPFVVPKNVIGVSGDVVLDAPLVLDGILPETVPSGASMQILAMRPNGAVEPLLWLYEYAESHRHPFLFRKALHLPAGSRIRGVPLTARVLLLPAVK